MGNSTKRKWPLAAFTVAGVLLIGGGVGAAFASGWIDLPDRAPAAKSSPAPTPTVSAPPVSFTALPADGAVEVNPAALPTLSATNAVIESATLAPEAGGEAVPGTVAPDGSSWTADAPLVFNTAYALKFTLTDEAGKKTVQTQRFTTVVTANEADAILYPLDTAVVGTGQPIDINFSEPVLNKMAIEQAITVTSSTGQVGDFFWLSDNRVRYRPESFWLPNSTITVDMQLFGLDLGNGMIGNGNVTRTFSTHNSRLAVVDNYTKTMQVFIDGVLTRTFPVTLGDAVWPSPSGYQVVMSQHQTLPFRAESIGLKPGDPDYYKPFDASWASRLTNTGVFVHQALPSAMSTLGRVNVSHGCVGMSPEGAKYFFDTFDPGDVVQVLNTGVGPTAVDDGFGDWNVPWEAWTAPQF